MHKINKLVVGALVVFGLIFLGGTGLVVVFNLLDRPPSLSEMGTLRRFRVQEGAGVAAVAQQLTDAGLVRSPLFFRLIARITRLDKTMKAGSYRLTVGLNSTDLINILQLGQPEELFRVTLPEGWTARKMAAKLEELEIVTAASFLAATRDPAVLAPFNLATASAEGYLFPDTYYWPKDFEAAQLVQIMLENFFSRLGSLELPALLSREQLQQKLILASILEREYRLAEEAPLIASVFYNRLRQGKRLESCATVLYVLTEEIGRPHPTRILFSDLEIPSSYNTYLNPGLPPGPISNPGLVALSAALKPAASDYFFFVVKDPARGSHTFTRSLTDHNQARARYLETFLR